MSVHPRSDTAHTYDLFKELFDDIQNKKILDFGGSSGNLLFFSQGEIEQNNYTCIDIVKDAIDQGKLEFSKSSFIHFNRFNWMYNHKGSTKLEFPKIDKNQDYIWAYSVFSHTDLDEFVKTVQWLTSFNYKKIAISFLTFNELLTWAYNKRTEEYGSCIDIKKYLNTNNNILYFFDNDKVVLDKKVLPVSFHKHLLAFYNEDYLKEIFLENGIKINILRPGDGYVPFLVIDNV